MTHDHQYFLCSFMLVDLPPVLKMRVTDLITPQLVALRDFLSCSFICTHVKHHIFLSGAITLIAYYILMFKKHINNEEELIRKNLQMKHVRQLYFIFYIEFKRIIIIQLLFFNEKLLIYKLYY